MKQRKPLGMDANMIDLRAFSDNRPVTEMLLLARGQLNRAFRFQRVAPARSVAHRKIAEVDPVDLDDPAGRGIGRALETYPEAFNDWSASSYVPRQD